MPRKERLSIPGALYHFYCRTARGERVLSLEAEAAAFLETLIPVRDLHGLTFLAWCFMSNHYHLVLRASEVPLWRSMARIQGRFARDFNRRHRYLGWLWQSRYTHQLRNFVIPGAEAGQRYTSRLCPIRTTRITSSPLSTS